MDGKNIHACQYYSHYSKGITFFTWLHKIQQIKLYLKLHNNSWYTAMYTSSGDLYRGAENMYKILSSILPLTNQNTYLAEITFFCK